MPCLTPSGYNADWENEWKIFSFCVFITRFISSAFPLVQSSFPARYSYLSPLWFDLSHRLTDHFPSAPLLNYCGITASKTAEFVCYCCWRLLRASQRWSTLYPSCRLLALMWQTNHGLRSTLTPRDPMVRAQHPQAHTYTRTYRFVLIIFSLCLAGVRGHGERGASKAGGKGKHPVQHAEDPTAEHDFLGCMSRSVLMIPVQLVVQLVFMAVISFNEPQVPLIHFRHIDIIEINLQRIDYLLTCTYFNIWLLCCSPDVQVFPGGS